MIAYKELLERTDLFSVLEQCLSRLREIGYGRMAHIPTHQAPDFYRDALAQEDECNIRFHPLDLHHFKETGDHARYCAPVRKSIVGRVLQCAGLGARPNDILTMEKLHNFAALLKGIPLDGKVATALFGPRLLAALTGHSLAFENDGRISLTFRPIPFPDGYIVCDAPSLGGDETVHAGLDSMYLYNFITRHLASSEGDAVRTALDMGCGSGMHTVLLQRLSPSTITCCMDINLRALACANLNFKLNGLQGIESMHGNWRDAPIPGERDGFDLILCNPPFEWRSDDERHLKKIFSDGGDIFGLSTTLDAISQIPRRLSATGRAWVLTQTLVDKDGHNIILDILNTYVPEILNRHDVTIHTMYEHLLVTESVMRNILSHSFSHFALVLLEIKPTANLKSGTVAIVDNRHSLKQAADTRRIKLCTHYWKQHLGC